MPFRRDLPSARAPAGLGTRLAGPARRRFPPAGAAGVVDDDLRMQALASADPQGEVGARRQAVRPVAHPDAAAAGEDADRGMDRRGLVAQDVVWGPGLALARRVAV